MTPVEYFKRFIIGYVLKDIETLLANKDIGAGPLMNTTMIGIDSVGGLLYGFGNPPGSRKRSTDFMKTHMTCDMAEAIPIGDSVSSFLYDFVRCGMLHQGVTKFIEGNVQYGVLFQRDPIRDLNAILIAQDNTIVLSVELFARRFLRAIDAIQQLGHVPTPASWHSPIPPPSIVFQSAYTAILSCMPTIPAAVHSTEPNGVSGFSGYSGVPGTSGASGTSTIK